MDRRVAGIAMAALLTAMGCSTAPTEPSQSRGLSLGGAMSAPTLEAREFGQLVFRLRNVSSETTTIEFSNSCRIEVYVETTAGRVVLPPSGIYICADVVTLATLAPNAEIAETVTVFGDGIMPGILSGFPLPEGRYRAYARVNANRGVLALRSAYVYFEVK